MHAGIVFINFFLLFSLEQVTSYTMSKLLKLASISKAVFYVTPVLLFEEKQV